MDVTRGMKHDCGHVDTECSLVHSCDNAILYSICGPCKFNAMVVRGNAALPGAMRFLDFSSEIAVVPMERRAQRYKEKMEQDELPAVVEGTEIRFKLPRLSNH